MSNSGGASRTGPTVGPDGRSKPQYDLFVVHAEADREWVQGYLLPELGLPQRSVVTTKSFTAGAPIVTEFERAVVGSRFTVIVLSAAFLADEWSAFGELLATHASVAGASDRLVPLLLEPCQIPLRVDFRVRLDCTAQALWGQEVARLRALLKRLEPPAERIACPYPGMVPFRPEEARLFHGREQEIEDLLRRLRHQRFLLIAGPSGSGKSSLVFAGLLPQLSERHGDRLLVRWMRPGGTPMWSLAQAFGASGPIAAEQAGDLVEALLQRHPLAERLLLVVDQLEEVFAQAPKDDLAAFLAVLNALRRSERCVSVLTMRADFYPDLMTCDLWPLGPGERLEIIPLRGEALRQAIVQPAAEVGVHLEPVLLERLLGDAADEPGVLPLVQETMVLLWERRVRRLLTLGAYEALSRDGRSGLEVALATKADATLAALSETQRAIARPIFLRLVQLGEGREDTRRQQPVAALHARGEDQRLFDQTLHHLTSHRLLTLSGEEQEPGSAARKVDLAHEALIAGWPTLHRWVDEDREGLRIRGQLSDDAREWERLGRDPGALYRGAKLVSASEWVDEHAGELNAMEQAFLDTSRVQQVNDLEAAQVQAAQQARAARRLRLSVVALSIFLLLAVISTAYAARQREQAVAQAARETSRHLAAEADVNFELDRPLSMLLSVAAFRLDKNGEARGSMLRQLILRPYLRGFLTGHRGPVTRVAFSPDGRILASAAPVPGEGFASGDEVILWDVRSRSRLGTITAAGSEVEGLAFSPDGRTLASLSAGISLWDVRSRSRVATLPPLGGDIKNVAFSPDGQTLAAGGEDGAVILWDVGSRSRIATLSRPSEGIVDVAFSLDGRTLASTGKAGAVILWDVRTRSRLATLTDPGGEVVDLAFPDGRTLATVGEDGAVELWDFRSRKRRATLTGHRDSVAEVAFSPDARMLARVGKDGAVESWDVRSRKRRATLTDRIGPVGLVAFSPDGRTLAAGGEDGAVALWNVGSPSPSPTLTDPGSGVRGLAFSPDRRTLATASGGITLWDVPSHGQLATLTDPDADIKNVAFSPDGRTLAAAGSVPGRETSIDEPGVVILWDVRSRSRLATFTDPEGQVVDLAFSPDGRTLAAADGGISLWDVRSRSRLSTLTDLDPDSYIDDVAFSPDGQTLAAVNVDVAVELWDVRSRKRRATLTGPSGPVAGVMFDRPMFNRVAFSPDGQTLAAGGEDGAVILWDVRTRSRLATLTDPGGEVVDLAFSPDGRTLAAAGSVPDRRAATRQAEAVILWDVPSRSRLATLRGPAAMVAFSLDGHTLASTNKRVVILWNTDINALPHILCDMAGRDLSKDEWAELLPDKKYRKVCA